MDAFDTDVVIYAAQGDPRGEPLQCAIRDAPPGRPAGVGSTLLLPETLSFAVKHERVTEERVLSELLSKLALVPATIDVADHAVRLRARYGLKTPDAIHLATAIASGADRFVTGNRKDFTRTITEIDIAYPGHY